MYSGACIKATSAKPYCSQIARTFSQSLVNTKEEIMLIFAHFGSLCVSYVKECKTSDFRGRTSVLRVHVYETKCK